MILAQRLLHDDGESLLGEFEASNSNSKSIFPTYNLALNRHDYSLHKAPKMFAVSCLAVVEKHSSEALKPFKGIIVQS